MQTYSTGKKIQSIANFLCGLGWLGCAVIGIAYLSTAYVIIGIIIAAICSYVVWAITRFLQGFGELVEDTAAIRENTDRITDILESQIYYEPVPPAARDTFDNVKHTTP